jgi:GNAT superfamily N-acetyltransferase
VGRAHGLGFKGKLTPEDIAHIEDFYFAREADAQVDVCPYADPSLFAALNERGFQVAEFNQTLARWISPGERFAPASDFLSGATVGKVQAGKKTGPKVAKKASSKKSADSPPIKIRRIKPEEAKEWSAAAAQIFFGDQAAQWENLFIPWSTDKDATCLAAFAGSRIVGTAGGLVVRRHNMMGLWGAATLPEFRGRGIQRAFFQERLRLAQQAGCDLAVTLTLPGTTSQRNAERAGFRPAYTKVVTIKRHPEGKGVYVEVPYSK